MLVTPIMERLTYIRDFGYSSIKDLFHPRNEALTILSIPVRLPVLLKLLQTSWLEAVVFETSCEHFLKLWVVDLDGYDFVVHLPELDQHFVLVYFIYLRDNKQIYKDMVDQQGSRL